MRLPITAGLLRGRYWLPASRGKLLRILGGTYEREQTQLFDAHISPGATVLDVGAHVGYYTMLSAVLAGPTGRVVAFEPNPTNARFLHRHIEINGLANVESDEAAVSDRAGTGRFDFGSGSGTGSLSASGAIEVSTVTLDEVCAERALTPSAVKIDVEGAEVSVLRGGLGMLRRALPVIFLSTHGAEPHRESLDLLRGLGYALSPILGSDLDSTSEVLALPPV